jgi:hypothetical protein
MKDYWRDLHFYFIFVLAFIGIYFARPDVFLFLFTTGLGNLFLAGVVVVVRFLSIFLSVILAVKFLITSLIFRLFHSNVQEGLLGGIPQYELQYDPIEGGWPIEVVRDFLNFQKAHNPDIYFDMKIIQKQATTDDARLFLKNGSWPWSSDTQRMYRDAIARNSYISMNPGTSLNDAQQVYNENAMKQLLSWNSKEGDFLLGGVIIGHTSGMPKNINNTVRCVSKINGDSEMQKKIYNGYNGINGSLSYTTTVVPNEEIPDVVPGFSFLAEKGVCNPCAPLNSPPDYSCPFIINTGNGTFISRIWETLWGMKPEEKEKKRRTYPAYKNSYLLGVSYKKKHSDKPVLNMNTNF